jgi:hypothetical protein
MWMDMLAVTGATFFLLDYYTRGQHSMLCAMPALNRPLVRGIFWAGLFLSAYGAFDAVSNPATLPSFLRTRIDFTDTAKRIALALLMISVSVQVATVVAIPASGRRPVVHRRPRPILLTMMISCVATGLLWFYLEQR